MKEHKITCHHDPKNEFNHNHHLMCRCICTCFIPAKCNCEEISCQEGCVKKHTHKGFSCEHCSEFLESEKQKSRQKAFDEVVGIAEGMTKGVGIVMNNTVFPTRFDIENTAYNLALSDLLTKLKEVRGKKI